MPKRKDEIRLSPKYGVNPSIARCFYCGKEKNEIVLPGRLKGDRQAPKSAVWDREPCTECKGWMKKGIICISVRDGEAGDNPYRTGHFSVITDEGLERILPKALFEDIKKLRFCFMEEAVWKKCRLPPYDKKEECLENS